MARPWCVWRLRAAGQVDGDGARYGPVEDHGAHAGPGVRGDDVAGHSGGRQAAGAVGGALEAVDLDVPADRDPPAAAGAGRVDDLELGGGGGQGEPGGGGDDPGGFHVAQLPVVVVTPNLAAAGTHAGSPPGAERS